MGKTGAGHLDYNQFHQHTFLRKSCLTYVYIHKEDLHYLLSLCFSPTVSFTVMIKNSKALHYVSTIVCFAAVIPQATQRWVQEFIDYSLTVV